MKNKFNIGRAIFAFAIIAGLSGVFSGTAQADDWNDHQRQAHDWHKRHRHHHERPEVIEQPNIVYAPPVVVEPPPTVDVPLSGMNIVIPVNIR